MQARRTRLGTHGRLRERNARVGVPARRIRVAACTSLKQTGSIGLRAAPSVPAGCWRATA
ncbi:hypothetical protein GCM10025795_45520 [Verticiella sediminum]